VASGNQAPGHTPKWLRHHRRVTQQEMRKEVTTISERTRNIALRVRSLSGRLDEMQNEFAEQAKERAAARTQLWSRLNGIPITVVQETHATQELIAQVKTARAPMPSPGGWAMDASSLLAFLYVVHQEQPGLVVECGSGSSTVWIAYVLEELGKGRILSLEHDPAYADETRAQLRLHNLESWASVIDAPLVPQGHLPGAPVWYDLSNLPAGLPGVDLLLVDGPPAYVGNNARYPAVPVMEPRLADSAAVVLDDTGRPDEQVVLERWMQDFSELTLAPMQAARAAFMMWNRHTHQGPS